MIQSLTKTQPLDGHFACKPQRSHVHSVYILNVLPRNAHISIKSTPNKVKLHSKPRLEESFLGLVSFSVCLCCGGNLKYPPEEE